MKKDIHGRIIRKGDVVNDAAGGMHKGIKVIEQGGELHLEGIKPLSYVNYSLEIVNR